MKKIIIIALVVILLAAIVCTIYYMKSANDTVEENEVSSVAMPFSTEDIDFSLPDDSTLNGDNPLPNLIHEFGDGSYVNLAFEEKQGDSLSYKDSNDDIFWYVYEEGDWHLVFIENEKISQSLSYSNYVPDGKTLKREELQQLSKQYLDKFIGENDYRIYRMDDDKIGSGTIHFFVWTKFINDIPTWKQQVIIQLTSDGNLYMATNPDENIKLSYLSNADSMTNMSMSYITEDEAIKIA
ncbi:MAG: hypothetical protein M0P77_10750, partial [Firmicutes bacterium]|nr:hypothetical protein [Bacillota bacterium]